MSELPFRVSYRERHIELPEQYSGVPCADNPDYDPFQNFPITGGKLILDISLDDFTRLLSSIVVGTEIIYPNDAYRLQDIFAFAINCNGLADDDEECEILVVTIDEIVQAVCNCENIVTIVQQNETIIEQNFDSVLQKQIDDVTTNDGNKVPIPDELLADRLPITPTGQPCNNDNAFSVAVGIVDYLHKTTLDFFDQLVGFSNAAEYVDEFIQSVPGVAAVYQTMFGAVDFVTEMDDWGKANYESSWTQVLEEEMQCLLFNKIACNNCEVSIDDVYDVYMARLTVEIGAAIRNVNLADTALLIGGLITNLSPLASVAAQAAMLDVLRWFNSTGLSNHGYNEFTQVVLKTRDDENNNWTVECGVPDCEYVYVWNEGEDASPIAQFATSTSQYATIDGSGFIIDRDNASQGKDTITFDSSSQPSLLIIDYELIVNNTQFGVITQVEIFGVTGNDNSVIHDPDGTYDNNLAVSSDGSEGTKFEIFISGTGERKLTIKRIEVRGFGANPYV